MAPEPDARGFDALELRALRLAPLHYLILSGADSSSPPGSARPPLWFRDEDTPTPEEHLRALVDLAGLDPRAMNATLERLDTGRPLEGVTGLAAWLRHLGGPALEAAGVGAGLFLEGGEEPRAVFAWRAEARGSGDELEGPADEGTDAEGPPADRWPEPSEDDPEALDPEAFITAPERSTGPPSTAPPAPVAEDRAEAARNRERWFQREHEWATGGLFPVAELDAEEAAAARATLPLELDRGAVVSWTGRRWTHTAGAARRRVPPDTLWFALRPLDGGAVGKRYRWTGEGWTPSKTHHPGRFDVHPEAVAEGVEGLADLFDRLNRAPDRYLVAGIPTRPRGPEGWRRVVLPVAPDGGDGAWFGPHPIGRRGVIFDVDGAAAPPWLPTAPTVAELERALREVVAAELPGYFREAAFAYHLSSSAGVRPWGEGLSCHLAFWLDRPIYAGALAAWFKTPGTFGSKVDPALSGPGQPIFTAPPLFEGAPDPLEAAGLPRTGLVAGAPVVHLPERFDAGRAPLCDGPGWHAHEEAGAARARVDRALALNRGALADWRARDDRQAADRLERRIRGYASSALRGAVHTLEGAGKGDRHFTALKQATKVFAWADFLEGGAERVRAELLTAFEAVAGAGRLAEARRLLDTAHRTAQPLTRAEALARLETPR